MNTCEPEAIGLSNFISSFSCVSGKTPSATSAFKVFVLLESTLAIKPLLEAGSIVIKFLTGIIPTLVEIRNSFN